MQTYMKKDIYEKVIEHIKTMSKPEIKGLMLLQLDGSIRLPFEYIILVYMKSQKFSMALQGRDLQGMFEKVKKYQDKLIEKYKKEIQEEHIKGGASKEMEDRYFKLGIFNE